MNPAKSEPSSRDPEGMLQHAADLSSEFLHAWRESEAWAPRFVDGPRHLVVAAVGGSATAGDYVAALRAASGTFPITVLRSGSLPAWAGSDTLVLAVSYSGNTGETLALFDQGLQRGCRVAAITSGGELQGRASRAGAPAVHVTYTAPPRAALGHLLAAILRVVTSLDGSEVSSRTIEEAAMVHRELAAELGDDGDGAEGLAHSLATWLLGGVPVIVGAEHLAPVATRFKNQLAENGKWLAATAELPEAAHNFVSSISPETGHHGRVLLLDSPLLSADVRSQGHRIAAICEGDGVPVRMVEMAGVSRLADLLEGTAWADYASCHVAFQRGIDPTPIPHIERLKIQRIS